jgi:tellurite resistance protein
VWKLTESEVRMMGNLTLEEKLVVDHEGIDSLPGYTVVLFEKLDKGGAAFSRLLNPGERFQKSGFLFWDKSNKYFSVAVNKSVLSYSFEEPITLDDEIHTFTLKFHLKYRASNPQLVAELRDQDPLRKLRDEIALVVGRACAQRKWEMVTNRFRELEVVVMNGERAALRQYAGTLGLEIFSVALDKRLPSEVTAIPKAQEKAEAEKREYEIEQELEATKEQIRQTREHLSRLEAIERQYAEIERDLVEKHKLRDMEETIERDTRERELDAVGHEHAKRVAQLDGELERQEKEATVHREKQRRKLLEDQTEAIGTAMKNVGEGISTPAELLEGAQVAQQISGVAQSNGGSSPLTMGLPGTNGNGYALGAGDDGLIGLANQFITESERWGCTYAQKQAVRSAVLHLVAEALLDDRADEQVMKQYADKLSEVGSSLQTQLTPTQFRFLDKLRKYEHLREYFS